jgi:hypothetical protein
MIIILSFISIGLIGFWIGFKSGAGAGYDEGFEVGRLLERTSAVAAFLSQPPKEGIRANGAESKESKL